jgi:hypothetical protein
MPFEKVEYSLPDPDNVEEGGVEIEVEPSSAKPLEKSKNEQASSGSKESGLQRGKPSEELDIEVVDDTPKADRGRKASDPPDDVTDEELEEYSEKVQKRIKHFSKGYHDERRAKEAALRERQELERYTQQLVEENRNLKSTVGRNQTALLDQAKQTIEAELSQAKKAYKDAYEAGDSDAVLEAQENLTNVKIKADRLNNIKLSPLQEEERSVDSGVNGSNNAPVQVDERAASWAESNTWFGTDDEMTSFALGLHNKLVKSGVDPRSDEYYESLDTRMRQVFPENFDDSSDDAEEDDEKRTPKRQANVVAPATRSTAPKKVVLTQTQVNLAKRLGVPLDEYAKQVAIQMRNSNG